MWHNPASGYFMFSFPTTDCSLALAKQNFNKHNTIVFIEQQYLGDLQVSFSDRNVVHFIIPNKQWSILSVESYQTAETFFL
jgi:hypothetical protein